MNNFLLIVLCLWSIQNLIGQKDIIDHVIQFEMQSELILLSDSKSYVKITEEYYKDSLIRSNTSESFYNYDSIKYCFNHEHGFHDMVYDYCELKKVTSDKFIQTTTMLYDDDFSKYESHLFLSNQRIDSIYKYKNANLESKITGVYKEGKLVEKIYTSNVPITTRIRVEKDDAETKLIVESEGRHLSCTVFTEADSIITLKHYQTDRVLTRHEEYEVSLFKDGKPREIKTFLIEPNGQKELICKVNHEYRPGKHIMREEKLKIGFVKTVTENYHDEKIIEKVWSKTNKRILEKYMYF